MNDNTTPVAVAARAQYWENIDPCALLEKLITLPEKE
jgi:hypothetical protein